MEKLSEQLQYLTSDHVGKVINEGLAVVYDTQPDHPITFLANWLLNYCVTQTNENKAHELEKVRKELIEKHQASIEKQIVAEKEKEEVQKQKESVIDEFKRKIEEHNYHEELLESEFPDFIKDYLQVPAVYVGYLGYPLKEIEEGDEDPNAHLDMTQEKLIRYVGASKDQKFMIGQTLLQETGITYDALKPQEEEEPVDEEEEEGILKGPKPTYVYVPDVTKQERMVYFRIPRLGAYITNSLSYKSVLNETAFDEGVKERQRVLGERAEQQKEREAKEAELQERIDDAQDQGLNVTEIEEEWKNMVWDEIAEKEYEAVIQDYVLCADTLGEDREIKEEQRAQFEELAKFYVKCWEESEKRQISNDIDLHLKYLSEINKEDFIDDLNVKVEDEVAEKLNEHDEGEPSETKTAYKQGVAKTETYKRILLDDEVKGYLTMLKEYRFVKYLGIIQTALILIGYTKEDINLPKTNILNWRKVSHYLNNPNFFDKLEAYQYQGPKPEKVKPYAYVQRILRRLEGYVIEEVDDYNVSLGVLYRFLKSVLETRILDVQVRNQEIAEKRRKREQLMQEAEELAERKEREHDEARQKQEEEIQEQEQDKEEEEGEEKEGFNWEEWEQEWLKNWEEDNPPIEIPEEVEDDIDGDMEPEDEAPEAE